VGVNWDKLGVTGSCRPQDYSVEGWGYWDKLGVTGSCRPQDYSVEGWGYWDKLGVTGSRCPQDYSVEGMSESLLTFLQHLREFGLVFQRKVTLGGTRGHWVAGGDTG